MTYTAHTALTGGQIGGIVAGVIVAILIILFICWIISARNSFVRMENQIEEAFHNIDVFLNKRYDLIPNLVETVKGYAKHERETLESVTNARAKAQNAFTNAEKIDANTELAHSMRKFNRIVEAYPELKANVNFLDLQNQLQSIEHELGNARKYYNATIKQFNTKIRTFPSSVIAGMMHLEKQPYFEVDEPEARKNIKVQF